MQEDHFFCTEVASRTPSVKLSVSKHAMQWICGQCGVLPAAELFFEMKHSPHYVAPAPTVSICIIEE